MRTRVVVLGFWPLLVAFHCSSEEHPGGGGAGAPAEGGESSGGDGTSGSSPGGGSAGDAPGGSAPTGCGGSALVAGCDGGGAGGSAGDAGSPTGPAAGSAGAGGANEGGAPSCIAEVGVMPPSPLAPATAACASGCSVPPLDGVTLPSGCGDASNTPPPAALGTPSGAPPGGWIIGEEGWPVPNGLPMTGAPCDVGWCPSVVPTVLAIGESTSAGPYLEHTAMKAGIGDLVHLARAQDLISFDYVTMGPTGILSRTEIDPETWADYMESPIPGQSGGWLSFGNVKGPAIGVGSKPGQSRVYAAYASVEPQFIGPQLSGPRFGTMVGDSLGFEDLPAGWAPLTDIQVDEQGDAIVLQNGAVWRHVDGGGWEEVTIPCDVTVVTDLKIDTENSVWYLMSNDSTLYRRAADGSWTKTASPGGKIVLAGGTVHLVSSLGSVYRAGSQWSQPVLSPAPASAGVAGVVSVSDVAIDACWAPHVAWSTMYDTNNYFFEMDYTRWTARGFLTLRRLSNDYPGVELAVTPGHAFIHGGGTMVVLPTR